MRGQSRQSPKVTSLLVAVPLLMAGLFAVVSVLSRAGGPGTTAFAEAGPGSFAIAIRNDGAEDTVIAVEAASGDVSEVAKVAHLEGYTSYAAVSPDGATVAVVAADDGTPARPIASLHLIDLASGSARRVATGVDQLQQPVWSPDSSAVFVTRTAASESAATTVDVLRVTAGAVEAVAMSLPGVAGAYPVGFDANGRLLVVAVAEQGSVLYREAGEPMVISAAITRDWRVSPDGAELAFIEAQLENGLSYVFNSVRLDGAAQSRAQAAVAGQQLGVAWSPAGGLVVGQEPGAGNRDISAAGGGTSGFDLPIAFSSDGRWLAVEAWDGPSFATPGSVELQVISNDSRTVLPGAQRFAGWTVR